ncbi:MAG: 1-acyl-sn-glycerol-3-phosphate acyltransferase [Candidatus Cryptobacteroides sp.]
MWRKFCGWLLKTIGWTCDSGPAPEKKCILLGVPHTSVWDFAISYLFYTSVGGKAYCMIKKEFFWGPLGWLLRKLGGVPVDRSNATALVLSIIHEMEKSDYMHLAIAPEGTRKPAKRWKTGFHTIATKTGVPVYLSYFDWRTKHIGIGKKFELSEDARADMDRIQAIYEDMHLTGKYPDMYITH